MDREGIKERARGLLAAAGACRVGFAEASPVDPEAMDAYREWLSRGHHAGMDYLERHLQLRADPRLLHPGARTVIVCAFAYPWAVTFTSGLRWARYALGDDYHDALRRRLSHAADALGGSSRICVDTAPIPERYWAVKAGIGFVGRNRQLIVPGIGSRVLLAEILTDIPFAPDAPASGSCPEGCRRCLDACPGNALGPGGLDARLCRSYLTIEHRGALPDGLRLGQRVYGCDICAEVCPLNAAAGYPEESVIPELRPRPGLLALTAPQARAMSPGEWQTLLRRSAIKRAKPAGILRNLDVTGPY